MATDRSTGRGLPFEVLREAQAPPPDAEVRGGPLPAPLAQRYGPTLAIPLLPERPTLIANFVTSLDGVVAVPESGGGGGEISGFFEPDRFSMGLLRTLADVIVIGAGTVRQATGHEWTPRKVSRANASVLEAWRREMGLAPQPTTIIVTGRGDVDPTHPALNAPDVPVIVLTTPAGEEALRVVAFQPHVRVRAVPAGETGGVPPAAILDVLGDEHARLALCEGGPHLMADLLSIEAIDELFLTLAPQLVGRAPKVKRLSFIEGFAYPGGHGRWTDLLSLRAAGDHLFMRQRLKHP